jgi:hypothetical protein
MTDAEFDAALVQQFFAIMGERGVFAATVPAAAEQAGLSLATARQRFTSPLSVLCRFGELADVSALTGAASDGVVRDRLFDILMRRFDFHQTHRAGVVALLKHLPLDPFLAAGLSRAALSSMGWMLAASGVPVDGPLGFLRKKGLLAVWLWGVRAWLKDDSADLTATMAAVDTALNRADQLAMRFMAPPATTSGDASIPDALSEVG